MAMMKAAVIRTAGGPEVLKIESLPIPEPRNDQVLIHVKAFGLNRSELFTRQGQSPNVKFPRVLGIEAVGLVESAPGNQFRKGEKVATAMGGMGRELDGGYAEYTCVPVTQMQAIKTELSWEILGASTGDAPDRLGLAVQVVASRRARAPVDPRRYNFRRFGRGDDREEPRGIRRLHKSQSRTAPHFYVRAGLTKYSSTPVPSPNKSRKCVQEVSTRSLNWWVPRR